LVPENGGSKEKGYTGWVNPTPSEPKKEVKLPFSRPRKGRRGGGICFQRKSGKKKKNTAWYAQVWGGTSTCGVKIEIATPHSRPQTQERKTAGARKLGNTYEGGGGKRE